MTRAFQRTRQMPSLSDETARLFSRGRKLNKREERKIHKELRKVMRKFRKIRMAQLGEYDASEEEEYQ